MFLMMPSIGLSLYISRVEDGVVCGSCEIREKCIAYRKLGKSNWLSEFMLVTYILLYTRCKVISRVPVYKILALFFSNIVVVSLLFVSSGPDTQTAIYAIATTMLLALSIVDWNTQYIPIEYTGVIFLCGLIHLFADFSNWLQYLIGLIAVSGFLCIVNWIATPILKKKYRNEGIDSVIGDGDIKLMAATGLLLGWKLNFIALGIGCIAGSVIHLILMKVKGSGRQFAFGPYLSLGVYITMICGEQLVSWYLNILGVNTLL